MNSNLLEIKDLGLFLSGRWLFRNLELSIPPSTFVAITGPSGVGKTSLLRLLTKEIFPTEGKITINLTEDQPSAMIFQDLQLANGASTLTNVLGGSLSRHSSVRTLLGFPSVEKERSLYLLDQFGLANQSRQWASTLSRGERQRLAICRTLLSAPTLLLADEPVASLDSDWANRTLSTLKSTQQKTGGSIVCSLHDDEQVHRFADIVLRLNPENPAEWTWEELTPVDK
jgi:phosphonate transport system ATP-binding protein